VEIEEERFELEAGTVALAAPNEVMTLQMSAGTQRFVLCLREGFLSDTAEPLLLRRLCLFGRAGRGRRLRLGRRDRVWMEERLASMAEELRLLDPQSRSILAAQLLETLHRAERIAGRDLPAGFSAGDTPWAGRFLSTLEATYLESHRVEELAGRMGVSCSQLHALVQTHFNSSPKRLLSQRLLLEAKRRLDHSEKTAAQIAAELGFADPAYFSRFFRRWAGSSPGAYRRLRKVPAFQRNGPCSR
jgi:AraC family transcriptional activator of pobA